MIYYNVAWLLSPKLSLLLKAQYPNSWAANYKKSIDLLAVKFSTDLKFRQTASIYIMHKKSQYPLNSNCNSKDEVRGLIEKEHSTTSKRFSQSIYF